MRKKGQEAGGACLLASHQSRPHILPGGRFVNRPSRGGSARIRRLESCKGGCGQKLHDRVYRGVDHGTNQTLEIQISLPTANFRLLNPTPKEQLDDRLDINIRSIETLVRVKQVPQDNVAPEVIAVHVPGMR